MPKDKTETHERIIPAAMKIFLEKGFEKATMREIAEEAGITAAGLYRHFVDKEAMFAALVEPVLSELQKWCERTRQVDYDFLEQGDLDAMWDSGNDLGLVVDERPVGLPPADEALDTAGHQPAAGRELLPGDGLVPGDAQALRPAKLQKLILMKIEIVDFEHIEVLSLIHI